MKSINPFCTRSKNRFFRFYLSVFTTSCLLLCQQANARFVFQNGDSSNAPASEKKVDYLEKIYFSGENKDGLVVQIKIALQNIQEALPTQSLAKQATFLIDIEDDAEQASNSCDILDLLAVGIYKIDPSEASSQGVRLPSDKAKKKSVNAIESLDKLNNSAYNLSNTAHGAAWESYMLSGGNYGGFVKGASKVGNTAGKVGSTVKGASDVLKAGQAAKSMIGGFIKKKDKPCDDVTPKAIALGDHTPTLDVSKVINTNANTAVSTPVMAAPAKQESTVTIKTVQAKITIKGVSSNQVQTILSSITKITGVSTAESDSYSKNIAVLLIAGELKAGELANKIVEACKPLKLTVDNFSNSSNSAELFLKP